jgi:hypothetical protein
MSLSCGHITCNSVGMQLTDTCCLEHAHAYRTNETHLTTSLVHTSNHLKWIMCPKHYMRASFCDRQILTGTSDTTGIG